MGKSKKSYSKSKLSRISKRPFSKFNKSYYRDPSPSPPRHPIENYPPPNFKQLASFRNPPQEEHSHQPPPNPRPPAQGGLLLSCWCGKTFLDPVSSFAHCREVHGYSAHLLLHKTLAQLLSSDFSPEALTSQTPVKIGDRQNILGRVPSVDNREELRFRENGSNIEKTSSFDYVNDPTLNRTENSSDKHHARSKIDSHIINDRNTFVTKPPQISGIWLHDPQHPGKLVFMSEKIENWKDKVRQMRENGWVWGKGKYGEEYAEHIYKDLPPDFKARKLPSPALYKNAEAVDKKGLIYACPSCNVQGPWNFIKFHLSQSDHLIGGVRCLCNSLCVVKDCMTEHYSKFENKKKHSIFVGTLYSQTEFLAKNPYREMIDLSHPVFKITRLEPEKYMVEEK